MSTQSILRDVGHDERRNAFEFLKRLDRFAQVFFPKKIQIKLIVVLEHAVQSLLETRASFFGMRKTFAGFRKFCSSRDANFVPIKEIFLEFGERFVCRFHRRILQTTGINHVFENRSIGGRRNNLILFFDKLVELGDQICTVFGGHLITLKLLIKLI